MKQQQKKKSFRAKAQAKSSSLPTAINGGVIHVYATSHKIFLILKIYKIIFSHSLFRLGYLLERTDDF
jgi:hypothetical protein